MRFMKEILERAREIILRPQATWQIINSETVTLQELIINYAAPLALIPALAAIIGLSLVGIRLPQGEIARAPFFEALVGGVVGYVFHLLGLLAGAWVIAFLAPYFNAKSDLTAALKLVVYSMTPVWLLGIFSALPGMEIFQLFGLYSIYLLFLGLPVVLNTPLEKRAIFTILISIAGFVISLILTIIVGGAVYYPMFLRMMAK